MNRFLENVVEMKREEVALKRRRYRINELECRASRYPVRDFRASVSGDGPGSVIAEIKKKSPTVTRFLQNGNVERLAEIYQTNGAAAISIVADEPNFGTSLGDVERVRNRTRLPILVKEFVIDGLQILEARASGADAVLLIARILEPDQMERLLDLTRVLGMSALVECHDEADVERALTVRAPIIGINNRDLESLTVSLETTRRLLPRIPEDKVRVSESGISTRQDIETLRGLGVNAFLIGGALLGSGDPAALLRDLTGSGGKSGGGRRP